MRFFQGIKAALKTRFITFFASKIKPTDTHILTQRRIYIFANRYGVLFAVLLLCLFIAGINYANNMVMGLCFVLASMVVVSLHITYAQLSGVTLHLHTVQPAFSGDTYEVTLALHTKGRRARQQLQLYFDVSDDVLKDWLQLQNEKALEQSGDFNPQIKPAYIRKKQAVYGSINDRLKLFDLCDILPTEINTEENSCQVSFVLPALPRGRIALPRLVIKSVYPFGLIKAWAYVYFKQTASIAPRPVYCNINSLLLITESPLQEKAHPQRHHPKSTVQDMQIDALKSYHAGDTLSRVDWKRYAKGQGLYSKVMDYLPTHTDVMLRLSQMPAQGKEEKLQLLAGAAILCELQQVDYGVQLPNQQITYGQGLAHLRTIMTALVDV